MRTSTQRTGKAGAETALPHQTGTCLGCTVTASGGGGPSCESSGPGDCTPLAGRGRMEEMNNVDLRRQLNGARMPSDLCTSGTEDALRRMSRGYRTLHNVGPRAELG